MKWFKHMATARHDIFMQEIFAEHGHTGYAVWWMLMEIVAGNCGTPPTGVMERNTKILAGELQLSVAKMKKFFNFFEKFSQFSYNFSGKQVRVEIPNMLKLKDKYSQDLIATSQRLTSQLTTNAQVQSHAHAKNAREECIYPNLSLIQGKDIGSGKDLGKDKELGTLGYSYRKGGEYEGGKGETQCLFPFPTSADKKQKNSAQKKTCNQGNQLSPAPSDFTITANLREWANQKNISVDLVTETEMFLDYHRAKGNRFVSWPAAWRNWMRRADKIYAESATTPTRMSAGYRRQENYRERVEREERENKGAIDV